jgi:hypothetical protein
MSSLTDTLRAAAEAFRSDIAHWNGEIAGLERDITIRRERIAAAELDAVERMAAANILDEMDLTVDRVDGVPHVAVARTLAVPEVPQ